jgi:Ca-activated chloride channel family protein
MKVEIMKNIFFSLMILVMTLVSGTVSAADAPRAVIIFDASGSMWGQIHGKAKIEIARDALKNVVREWNPNVELGLTVYGHRSKGDCNDIESIIPVGKVDKNRVIRTVMSIKPKGKTPISRSLRKVAEEIKYTEEKATIILISDGKETCDPDPCGTAKELEAQGIDFVTHVIGFNVDKKTDKQLECIARATGGEYFSAKNANALNKAMKVIVKKVEVVKPKPVVKKVNPTVEVTASETEGGKWIEAHHHLFKIVDGEKENGGGHWSYKKKPLVKQLPVGKYIFESSYKGLIKETAFEMKAGEITKLHIIMGSTGKVEVTASETEGGKWISAYCRVYNEDKSDNWSVNTQKKNAGKRQLPVGKYTLKCEYNAFKKENIPLEIKAGEVTKVHVVMGETGKVEVSASEKEGGKWISAYCRAYNEDKSDNWSVNTQKKNAGKRQLPVGKYLLKCEYNDFKKEVPFEIKSGKTAKVHVVFGQFTIGAKCSDNNTKVFYEIYASSGQLVYEKALKCSKKLKLSLNNGKYNVEAKVRDNTKEASFTIGNGKTNKLILDLTNLNHEEEIKADSQEAVVVPVTAKKREVKNTQKKSSQVNIGGKKIEIEGMSEKEAKQIEQLGAMLGAFGSMIKGTDNVTDSKKQKDDNKKADKEFDEMSKDLDMFTK